MASDPEDEDDDDGDDDDAPDDDDDDDGDASSTDEMSTWHSYFVTRDKKGEWFWIWE